MTKKRIQIVLNKNAYQTLVRLQKDSNASSIAEVLRNAVGLYDWARAQRAEGFAVGAFRDGAPAKEVVLPFVGAISND